METEIELDDKRPYTVRQNGERFETRCHYCGLTRAGYSPGGAAYAASACEAMDIAHENGDCTNNRCRRNGVHR